MDQQLIVYRSYDNFDRCAELTSLLNQHNIPFETEQFQKSKDELFTGRYSGALQFIVKISPTDLSRANTLYEYSLATTENHSFHLLSNKELEGVLVDSEEWADGDIHIHLSVQDTTVRSSNQYDVLGRLIHYQEKITQPNLGATQSVSWQAMAFDAASRVTHDLTTTLFHDSNLLDTDYTTTALRSAIVYNAFSQTLGYNETDTDQRTSGLTTQKTVTGITYDTILRCCKDKPFFLPVRKSLGMA